MHHLYTWCLRILYALYVTFVGVTRDPKKGAATTLYAAVHPDLNKEEVVYYSDCKGTSPSRDSR